MPKQVEGFKAWRSLLHLLAGCLCILLYQLTSKPIMIVILSGTTGICLLIDTGRLQMRRTNDWLVKQFEFLLKTQEWCRFAGPTYFTTGCLLVVVLFPQSIAIAAIAFLSVGDVAAALIGSRWGRVRILNKTLEGSAACLIASFACGCLLCRLLPGLSSSSVLVGALAATLAELLPLPLNDNVTLPLVAAVAMWGWQLV